MARAADRDVMPQEGSGVGAGWVLFAGIMMMVGGFFAFFEGLAAVLKGADFYTKVPNYPFGDNVKTWGWIVLIAGVIVLLAGIYVMRGALWARIVGITIASLSAFANFFFIPFYPFWALTVITLDIFVIWALAAHGKALVEE
jgi:tetrahydromethanopterin S-methyltransferase subunit C